MTYRIAGIYGLYNVMQDKIYIGMSSDIGKRFAAHRASFRKHSNANPMYQEPLEHFAFLVLREMTSEDFSKYGKMMEQLFIERAIIDGMRVYNQNCTIGAIYEVFNAFDMYDTIQNKIMEECGTRRCWIKMRSDKNKQEIIARINQGKGRSA